MPIDRSGLFPPSVPHSSHHQAVIVLSANTAGFDDLRSRHLRNVAFQEPERSPVCCSWECGTLSGCLDAQLRKNTVAVGYSSGEIQQQQVLDNLAMFVCDYNAFPSFCYPNQGGSNVTDADSASASPGFSRIGLTGTSIKAFVFSTLGLNFGASRTCPESFTLTPVNDPRKLELMRCAYQRAVSSCGMGVESTICPDCKAIFNKFYTGDVNGDIREHANGIVTSECLNEQPCWFHAGCRRCVPKHCACVGHYCDTYVWVLPEGRDELTKLTLAILDYAINNAPAGLSKQILYYIDEYGLPTTRQDAVGAVQANVAIDEQPASLLNRPQSEELRIERILKDRLRQIDEEIASILKNYPGFQAFSGDRPEPDAGPRRSLRPPRCSRQKATGFPTIPTIAARAQQGRSQAAISW